VTPNADEARALCGLRIRNLEDLKDAARKIREHHGCGVLVKGGHLSGSNLAVDVLRIGNRELVLSAPFTRGVRTHGTGCLISAAITGRLALGHSLVEAVELAKHQVTQAIAYPQRVGRHHVLDPFH